MTIPGQPRPARRASEALLDGAGAGAGAGASAGAGGSGRAGEALADLLAVLTRHQAPPPRAEAAVLAAYRSARSGRNPGARDSAGCVAFGPVDALPTTLTSGPSRRARLAAAVPPGVRMRTGMLCIAATGVLWGTIGIAVRLLQDASLSPGTISFWRLVCACLVLVPLLRRQGLLALAGERRRPWRLLVVGAGSLGFQLLYFVAVRDVGVAVATLVTLGLAPVLAGAWESLSARTWPAPATVAVLVCALTGLVLVTARSGADAVTAPRPGLGLLEAVASAVVYAATTVAGRPLSQRLGPLVITAGTSLVGLVLLLPAVVVAGAAVPLEPLPVLGLVHLGTVTTVLAYGLFYAGLRTTPGSVAMVLTLLEPVTAVLLAALLLHEPLTATGAVGAVLVLGSVAGLALARPGRPPDAAPVRA